MTSLEQATELLTTFGCDAQSIELLKTRSEEELQMIIESYGKAEVIKKPPYPNPNVNGKVYHKSNLSTN